MPFNTTQKASETGEGVKLHYFNQCYYNLNFVNEQIYQNTITDHNKKSSAHLQPSMIL